MTSLTALSISASVVKQPNVMRMETSAWAGERPRARRRTCDGSGNVQYWTEVKK